MTTTMEEKQSHRPVSTQPRPQRTKLFLAVSFILLLPAAYLLYLDSPLSPRLFRSKTIEERARAVLSKHPLIDGHNDLAIAVRGVYHNHIYNDNFSEPFENGGFVGHVDLPRISKGQYGGAFWSLFYPCAYDPDDFSTETGDAIVRATLEQLDVIRRLGALYPDYFTSTKSAQEARENFKNKKLISPYAIEGLHQIGNRASNLRLYHQLGVRYATLTWNCHNIYADAAVITYPANQSAVKSLPHWGGLSDQGKQLVKEMNRLGMIVDLAHVSKDTMIDVLVGKDNLSADGEGIEISEKPYAGRAWLGALAPPIFSHSSAYSICPHPRNVPDSVLKLVKKRNSLVMVNFSPDFISCTPPPPGSSSGIPEVYQPNNTLHQVVKHIMHIGSLIGYDHVGIGTDFDGIMQTPRGLEDVSKFPDLIAELLRQGVTDENAAKVVGGNLLRVWDEVDRVSVRLQAGGMLPLEDDIDLWPGLGRDFAF